ncbi:hypothetical protein MFIFM68171_05647 [Madurella fahalii]|uniref:Copper transport protein n=1 Tax=Madurella fahalii TaxID=1157608 RepID=A0ABQ0GCF3_9PEZI
MSMSYSNITAETSMTMVLSQSATTPLFFDSWEPRNMGEYAGECITLGALAVITRILSVIRQTVEHMISCNANTEDLPDLSYICPGEARPGLSAFRDQPVYVRAKTTTLFKK